MPNYPTDADIDRALDNLEDSAAYTGTRIRIGHRLALDLREARTEVERLRAGLVKIRTASQNFREAEAGYGVYDLADEALDGK